MKELSTAELAAVALGPEVEGPQLKEDIAKPEPFDEEAISKSLRNWVSDYGDKAIPKGKGFITDFIYYTRGYMVPTLACIWSSLFVLSSAIKREAWIKFGPLSLFANLYMIIIGTAGRTKKTTAITQLGMPILQGFRSYITDKNLYDMKFINITKDMSTSEALLDTMLPEKKPGEDFFFVDGNGDHILGPDGKAVVYRKTSETVIIVSELSTFLNDTSYSDKTTALMLDLYDCHPIWEWKTLGRGKKFLKNLFTTFVAGTTVEGLRESIPKAAKGDGFLSRTIMVYVPSSKRKYAMPRTAKGAPTMVDMQQRLAWIAQHSIGEFVLSADAEAEYDKWYDWFYAAMEANPGIEGAISRMDVHLLKVALLIRASRYDDGPPIISKDDLMDAMMLLDATFVNLPFLLGQIEPDIMLMNLSKIELRLRLHPEGIGKWILGGSLRLKSDMLHAVLDELTARGQIEFLLPDPKTNEMVRHDRSTRKAGEIVRWIGDSYDGSAETLGGGEVSYFNSAKEIRKRKKSIKTPGCEPYEPVPVDEGEQNEDAEGVGRSSGGDEADKADEEESPRGPSSVGERPHRGRAPKIDKGDSEVDGADGGSGKDLSLPTKEGNEDSHAQDSEHDQDR